MSKLIVIEGMDGSGKETQTKLLKNRFIEEGLDVASISFPYYICKGSEPVKMYLQGELSTSKEDLSPYSIATLYAVDRYTSYHAVWKNYCRDKDILICDRYVSSNLIYQASRIEDPKEVDSFKEWLYDKEVDSFKEWLYDLEYNRNELPKPDITIFLNVPISYTLEMTKNRANKIDGTDTKDIHEADEEFLVKSHKCALNIAKEENWVIIECVEDGKLLPKEVIHERIYEVCKSSNK